jgi:hypothetical protein
MATKDGSQCGRRVADGSSPPICSVHQQQAKGNAGSLTQPVAANPEDIYQRLMRDSDPAIRLRAVDAWMAYQDKQKSGCDTCRARAEANKINDQFVAALTDDERDEMGYAMAPYRQFKERMYQRYPQLRPDGYTPGDPTPSVRAATRAETVDPRAGYKPAERRPIPVDRGTPEPEPVVTVISTPSTLGRGHWDSVGLFDLRDPISGKTFGCTHSLGDEHAQKILSGDIPLEQAQREHAESQADGENFVSASLHKLLTGAQS